MGFVLGAKASREREVGDHKALFEWVEQLEAHPPVDPAKRVVRWETVDGDGTKHCFRWLNGVPLNDTHFDVEVNFLDYRERRRNGKERRFSCRAIAFENPHIRRRVARIMSRRKS